MKKIKIVFFGATGNTSVQVVNYLNNNFDCEIWASGRRDNPFNPKINYIKGDILDKSLFSKLPKQVDVVFNFAGVQPSILTHSESTDFKATMESYIDVNIKGMFYILEYTRSCNAKKYFYATSHRDIEKSWINGVELTEDTPININYAGDHSMYAISKVSSMMMGDYYGETFNFNVYNLRLPMIFSAFNKNWYYSNGEKKIIPFLKIINDAYNGRELRVWGDPKMERDYVSIDNLFQIVSKLLVLNVDSGIFNIGTSEGVSTELFIKTIAKVFNPPGKKSKISYSPNNKTYKCTTYSIKKLQAKLDFEPVFLKEMLVKLKTELIRKDAFKLWEW